MSVPTTLNLDRIVQDAQSLPALLAKLNSMQDGSVEKQIAQLIEGKALIQSKTPWGNLIGTAVAYTAAYEGFGWDQNTCLLVAGVALLVMSYIMRAVTSGPIRGLFSRTTEPVMKTSSGPIKTIALLLCGGLALPLMGCGVQNAAKLQQVQTQINTAVTNATAQAQVTVQQAQKYAQLAINLWGIAKGIALAAEVADPSLAPTIDPVIAFVDPKIVLAQAALNQAVPDVATLMGLVTTIQQQANNLTVTAAPSVKVTPSPTVS